jgi:uncharacterized protein YkwD
MNHLSKIVVGLTAIQSVGAANITGVIDVNDICYQEGSTKITGSHSVTFDCKVDDDWSGNIDPTLSIKTRSSFGSSFGSFSSGPTVDIDLTLDFNSTGVSTDKSECSLSSTGSSSMETSSVQVCSGTYIGTSPFANPFGNPFGDPSMSCTGTSVSISETFKSSTGKLLCQPAILSYSNVTGTLANQNMVCTLNRCEHLPEPGPSAPASLPIDESTLTGDISVNGGDRQQSATLNLSDPVEVSGNITVASAHIGQTADLFVYVEMTIPGVPTPLYFMLKGEPTLQILAWDQNPVNLVAFNSNVILAAVQQVSLYQGKIPASGNFKVYFGYRLADGTLVKNTQPIEMVVNPDSIAPPVGNSEPAAFAGTLVAHNVWRQQVGVPDLTWSEEAAKVAQDWANHQQSLGCTMAHNPDRGNYGENVYWAMGSTPSPKDVVDAWGSEIVDYDYATNSCQPGKVCGHYTQVVWRDTQKVGCGTASCNDGSIFWVCNYDPPGNYMGQTPY